MILETLIKKGGLELLVTKTPATVVTQQAIPSEAVADVAAVAVAIAPSSAPNQTPSPLAELSVEERQTILMWLNSINETDQKMIQITLNKCRTCSAAKQYCLQQANSMHKAELVENRLVTCGSCAYFQSTVHPFLGLCAKGEPEAPAGLVDTEHRYCTQYLQKPYNI